MQVGVITVGGRQIGVVTWAQGAADTFTPDLSDYEPMGRADGGTLGGESSDHIGASHRAHHGGQAAPSGHHHSPAPVPHKNTHHFVGHEHHPSPSGHEYAPAHRGSPFHQGSADTDKAIVEAARAHHLDPNTMRGIASIESSMNPSSNANRATQYKGLYQIGRDEWRRFGNGGNIYSAQDNAMGAARMFEANRSQFRQHFGRDPTDTELYMMHQQGLGFYTRGAMTNISGNPYPGMHGPQTHESFEAGWGRELARRKAAFAAHETAAAPPPEPTTPAAAPETHAEDNGQ